MICMIWAWFDLGLPMLDACNIGCMKKVRSSNKNH
jgi:hypothetical protein